MISVMPLSAQKLTSEDLIARDAFNGTVLWKQPIPSWHNHLWPLKSGPTQLARRLVAQRCVYGVDNNPFAVHLARLSLWLVTRSRHLPFTFVDHALRCGDSLVGLSLAQIRGALARARREGRALSVGGGRYAMGAQAGAVQKLVLGEGLKVAAVGLVIGIGGAWVLTGMLESLLYGIDVRDPLSFLMHV